MQNSTSMGKFESLSEIDVFYDMLMANKLTSQGPHGTCVEYATAHHQYTNKYIQTSRTINSKRINSRTNTVALLKKIKLTELPDGLEASHLCHNKRCMSVDHIVAEPHEINMSRNTCAYMRNLTGDKAYCSNSNPTCVRSLYQARPGKELSP